MKKIILALLLIGSSPSLFCMDLDGYGSQFITKEEHESNFTIRSSCYMTGYLASFLYSGFACHTLINNQLSAGDKILIGLSIPMTWLLSTLCAAKKDFIGVRVTEDNPDNAPKINALLNGIIPKPPTTILHNITEERIIAIPKDISKMLYDKARITSCNVANKEK